eukprot:CAMPEP_0116124068 /NCGR_PEP_ID=MMETSP0329-20121206/5089_1 /TAXON_ID=697910 /ORGANISM="Pseudo-nitzschia arenysensis, Strain B593" /LENGTH=819 /DNA_ID=CAMNT_0003618035 /DNA_START=211 /DNA_END=2670 /DNA_ORIENTATION=+
MSTKGVQKSGADSKSAAPTNAWAKRLQSKLTPAPPPGMGPLKQPSSTADAFTNRERLLHLSLTLVGRKVVVHQTNGAIVEGIFHTFTPFENLPADQKNLYVLKEIIIQQQPLSDPALKDGVTLVVPASKVAFVQAAGVASDLKESNNMNGGSFGEGSASKGAFATDTQISSVTSGRTNDLVVAGNAWTSGATTNYRNQSTEAGRAGMRSATNSRAAALSGNKDQGAATTADLTSGSIGQWDQFKANKELFNVNATFDESLYTTELDTSKIDSKKLKEAERIAKEIQNTTTDNIHMAEERGFKVETDFDEEDLYSGVLTKDGKQRHEKVTITKPGKESKNVGKSAAPKKIMNYAAAAAKADTSKSKTAPPGFSNNGTPAAATKEGVEKETKSSESSSAVVTPEKSDKEGAKVAEKSEPSKVDAKSDEEKAEKPKPESKETAAKEKEAPKEKDAADSSGDKKSETKDKETEKKAEKKEVKKTSKLNANAKSFTFNPSAKSFTPSFGAGASSTPAPQQPPADPNMQMYGGVHPMQPPHYMQAGPMGQPGMMPMMNPQYPGMRYPSSYGMEQPMSQMQHQAPHVQAQATPSVPSAPSSGNAPTPTPGSGPSNTTSSDDEGRQQQSEDSSQTQTQTQASGQQQSQRSQQQPDQPVHSQGPPQQQIPMPYNVPPNAYFSAGMAMPPRGPGYPQFVGGPQQIAGRPGVPPYGMYPMQPGGMPQNMQMRGPNGGAYYTGPNGPMPYPPNAHMYPMMDDGGRGRGGRSSNGGRGGRGRGGRSGRGGRGRSNYNNNGGGKNTQYNQHQSQQQPAASQSQSGNNSSSKSD